MVTGAIPRKYFGFCLFPRSVLVWVHNCGEIVCNLSTANAVRLVSSKWMGWLPSSLRIISRSFQRDNSLQFTAMSTYETYATRFQVAKGGKFEMEHATLKCKKQEFQTTTKVGLEKPPRHVAIEAPQATFLGNYRCVRACVFMEREREREREVGEGGVGRLGEEGKTPEIQPTTMIQNS